jgi:hypothetical protein
MMYSLRFSSDSLALLSCVLEKLAIHNSSSHSWVGIGGGRRTRSVDNTCPDRPEFARISVQAPRRNIIAAHKKKVVQRKFTMAASSEIRIHVENFGTTQPLFSESFSVAKTRVTLTRREEKVRRQWNKERATFRKHANCSLKEG